METRSAKEAEPRKSAPVGPESAGRTAQRLPKPNTQPMTEGIELRLQRSPDAYTELANRAQDERYPRRALSFAEPSLEVTDERLTACNVAPTRKNTSPECLLPPRPSALAQHDFEPLARPKQACPCPPRAYRVVQIPSTAIVKMPPSRNRQLHRVATQ